MVSGQTRERFPLARWLRDAWLVIGVTLAMFLVAEWGYRTAVAAYHRATPRRQAGVMAAGHPYAGERWIVPLALFRDGLLHDSSVYDPYRGWRVKAGAGPGLTVDSAGLRLTVQPQRAAANARRVFLLGGSTMWGFSARDSATIPSLVAARLASRGISDVEVVNLAQVAYNVTQGAASLVLELRRGSVPAAVVSLDGVNEVDVVVSGDRPGDVTDQGVAENRFSRKNLALDVIGHSRLVGKLLQKVSGPRQPIADPQTLCGAIARNYREIVRVEEALGREYGFATFMLWQPTLAETHKPLTPFEAGVARGSQVMQQATVRCGALADSLLTDRTGRTYFPLHDLFDRDTGVVFIDSYGHITERANGVVADRIADLLVPVLASRK